ncbi:redox-regulated ATPase YchF [Candidatus Daviesbacteria bacterium RIFCSPHIGHO2_12_FULL_37_11]|uniref:Ribosome-binding ATPase YchF n=1 Tax=Candidatus Daviesbacteria bacterium RIFCSPHIGHO2_12_FULL_37_11 TaxID=1797777 RepID=A0A1F5KBQ3_9BACT|nr:MAG: redox-regulated ATPase YchF [Candidatus Daviesbacteria bacterium RIFCSPHIGHO2_01_FULL_37_27]OGE38041.1 MAG: redox-regulated ATPase YchF [Candidatus Daviesbacteria bacterium RIFCSPHIGHO2_12_FULL_37_11]OGE44758.1 MAG: redox-regulated ATPase YchF [Candidatus Daviesbacteria bacterium RIFCSPLOWO2_01_FULL_37_10]
MSSLKCGLIGLPNVGKSTLFNALLKKRVALSANYPFATVEPNVGVVAVPDERLEKLAELVAKEEGMISQAATPEVSTQTTSGVVDMHKYLPPIMPAVVEFVDIAGLVKGASTGAGLGNQFLSHIREVDAIIHVLRDFEDPNIVREGSENPDSDRLTIETELGLADLQVIEKLISGQEKQAKGAKDPFEAQKLEILKKIAVVLEVGEALGNFHIGDERLETWFKTLPLLSIKPVLYVYNVSEGEYAKRLFVILGSEATPESEKDSGQARMTKVGEGNSLVICAKLEEELADLSEEERIDYLKELGIEETGLERLIKKAYQLLGLISFLTAGKKEVRAWTIKAGTKAPQAAGVIHTDFEKSFIRAQVIEYEKLTDAGSYGAAKTKGWIRTEGKDYEVKDGDVIEFLVSS